MRVRNVWTRYADWVTRRNTFVDPVFSPETPLVPPGGVASWLEGLSQPIAVTGGTGFVGSHLVDALCNAGLRPRVLVRDAASPRWIAGRPVEWIEGALEDPDALDRLVEGAGAVVHLAGVLRGANEDDFMAGNRDGTVRLIASIERNSPDARVVYVSSQAAVGPADGMVGATVDIEPRPISAYGRSKAAAEQMVRAFQGSWAILRPPAIYGPRDTDVFEFFRLAARGMLIAPSGERWLTIAHVRDVVRAVIAVAAVRQAADVYHVGATSSMVMDAMLREIAEAGDVHARLVHLPPWVFRAAGAGASALRMLGMRRVPLSRDKADEILAKHWVLETRTSLDQLGLEEPMPFDEGARMTWQWYREAGWL